MFNLIQGALSETEIQVLLKGLMQRRRMGIKWNFRSEISDEFNETTLFRCKYKGKPPWSHHGLELFSVSLKREYLISYCLIPHQPNLI